MIVSEPCVAVCFGSVRITRLFTFFNLVEWAMCEGACVATQYFLFKHFPRMKRTAAFGGAAVTHSFITSGTFVDRAELITALHTYACTYVITSQTYMQMREGARLGKWSACCRLALPGTQREKFRPARGHMPCRKVVRGREVLRSAFTGGILLGKKACRNCFFFIASSWLKLRGLA